MELNRLVSENVHAITGLPIKRMYLRDIIVTSIFEEFYLKGGGENQVA